MRSVRSLLPVLVLLAVLAVSGSGPAAAGALEAIRARDSLACGVPEGSVQELLAPGSHGGLFLFEADLCRALAAAVLGDAHKVTPVSVTAATRIEAVTSGAADLVFQSPTVTARRERAVAFPIVYLFEEIGGLAEAASGIRRFSDLRDGSTVCVIRGSTHEPILADFAARSGVSPIPVPVESLTYLEAYRAGRCQVVLGNLHTLASERVRSGLDPDRHRFLDGALVSEPLSPMVRRDDPDWQFVVRWVLNGLILAEEKGLDRAGLAAARATATDPETRRLLGFDPHPLEEVGLPRDALARALEAVGHYGEIHERAFGPGTPAPVPRGRNALARNGGLLYAYPYR